jgi:hypothetical protein
VTNLAFKGYVSGLTPANALGGTELLPAIQGGNDVAYTPAQIKSYLIGGSPPTRDAGNVGFVLAQGGIPLIYPSSGTMGNNGALSGITALTKTYANAFLYMPAGAIASGSAAGWYFGQGSSTTAFTLFNNLYTAGTPTAPLSTTAFATTGPGAYTQTTGTPIVAVNYSLAANTFGANGGLETDVHTTQNNSANTKAITLNFGGSSAGTTSPTTATQSIIWSRVHGQGATNIQAGYALLTSTTATSTLFSGPQRFTVDTTSAVAIQTVINMANAGDWMVIEDVSSKVFPN